MTSKSRLEQYGKDVLRHEIEACEVSRLGWVPMFYFTGSCEGDWAWAERAREVLGEPRPAAVSECIAKDRADYAERCAAIQAERARHDELLKKSWRYWFEHWLKQQMRRL